MKSEAVLQVNDTDHSDTTSEMSDEGYRSLGIVHDKSKQRSSLYSQNSAEDAEDNEHHQVYTEDDLNDFGLRKTQFSQRIYEGDIKMKLERNLQSMEKLSESPSKSPRTVKRDAPPPPPAPPQKEDSFTKQTENFTLQKEAPLLSRANSTERTEVQKTPRKGQHMPMKKAESKINTWNGRQKSTRPSLTMETFVSPFTRNSTGRRSVSAVNDRRASSANTSPTKGRLRQELLQAVKQSEDDETIAMQVQELLKKYGSLSTLNDEPDGISPKFSRNSIDRMSHRSPRKDSRPENNISRIPAPVSFTKA